MWPREEAKAFFAKRGEPLKVQLIDEKTEGQAEVSCYTIKDKRHLHRLLRRSARAVDRQAEGVQAAVDIRTPTGRATRATSRCSGVYGTAFFTDKDLKAHLHADRRGQEARPPQARPRARACSRSIQWAPGAAFWLDKGTTLYNTLANYMRDGAAARPATSR